MIIIEYILENSGWATGKIGDNDSLHSFDVSYLHDSLKELALSAIEIKSKDHKSIVFMGEPGEVQLILNKKDNNILQYELRFFEDWESCGLINSNNYKVIKNGTTTIPKYINQVRKNLNDIMYNIGPDLYKQKWLQHDFPIEEYNILNGK